MSRGRAAQEGPVQPAHRFVQYAAAFEETVVDDDWRRLEPYLAEDVRYTVTGGPPLGGSWQGRDAVLRHLKESLDQLDRRFDARRVEPVGEPRSGEDWFEMGWRAVYSRTGCPDLVFEGVERATFAGDRITLLEDRVAPDVEVRIRDYLARHLD